MKLLVPTVIALLLLFTLPTLASATEANQDSSDLKVSSLCQFQYPSDYLYESKCVQLTWKDTPRSIFGKYWQDGLRFNRMDRRHFLPGLWVKVPRRMADIKNFTPLPEYFAEAFQDPKFILIDQEEMFLGAYENGHLVFSAPVAVGAEGYRLQSGLYRVDAFDLRHESNLYQMEGTDRPYPMHYALRIYTDRTNGGWTTYWLHGRDIPGYPASHGCIGLYDEEMQKEYYKEPTRPILMDARRLYEWVIGPVPEDLPEPGMIQAVKGPRVLILGAPPEEIDDDADPGVEIVPATTKPSPAPARPTP